MNIGQERDFYAVRDIADNEVEYIAAVSRHRHGGVLNEHNSWFVDLYKNISALHKTKEARDEVAKLLIQFEEDLMSIIEDNGIEYLDLLLSESAGFFNEETHRAKFCYFLMIQFVRTKRMSERVKNALREPLAKKSINIDNVWPVEKYINAGHMALTLFVDRAYNLFSMNKVKTTGFQPVSFSNLI